MISTLTPFCAMALAIARSRVASKRVFAPRTQWRASPVTSSRFSSKASLRQATPDEWLVRGREIYLRLPNGVARSKLTNAYFDGKLSTVSTMRNLRTVSELLELVSG